MRFTLLLSLLCVSCCYKGPQRYRIQILSSSGEVEYEYVTVGYPYCEINSNEYKFIDYRDGRYKAFACSSRTKVRIRRKY